MAYARSRASRARSTSGESGAVPPNTGDGHMLYASAAKFTDLQEEIEATFQDLKLEMVACETCGSYHPPEIHLAAITPFDPSEPEEA
jgi:hypothetical protein